ncbi:hypothetical protein, partial [Actinomadura atramentaria]|uniref:hypothetical protein n=1 Tax=Actinomadura atramentaria TaxID=1990 RepID=UPI0003795B81
MAAEPVARMSPDGGDNFPRRGRRHQVPVGGDLPSEPVTVPVYAQTPDGATVGRLLVADFDTGRAPDDVDPAALVARQADDYCGLVEECGGRVVHDVSPSGGRHVYVRFARAVPWEELRDVVLAAADRYSTLDPAPMRSPSGQIRIAGSPYKRAPVEQPDGTFARRGRLLGYMALSMPLSEALAVLGRPCGPSVLDRLRRKLGAELAAVDPAPTLRRPLPGLQHTDDDGRPWAPLRGGRRPLPARLAELARTGAWDAPHLQPENGRYPSASEARYAVLRSLAAGGWTWAEAAAEMRAGGPLEGVAGGLCGTRSARQRTAVLTSDWDRAVIETTASRTAQDRVRNSHTSPTATHPPPAPPGSVPASASPAGGDPSAAGCWALPSTLALTPGPSGRARADLDRWLAAVVLAERDPVRCKAWGRRAVSVRLVLRALGRAAWHTGDVTVAWGTRSLALATPVSWRTVADVLADLREEDDPLVDLVRRGRDDDPDVYMLRVPDAYRADAARAAPAAGRIETGHPAWLADELGPVAALLYEGLTAVEARPADLERRARLSASATAQALRALGAYGLAERGPDGWRRGPRTLDDVATELDAFTLFADRVEQYQAHRTDHARFLAQIRPMRAAFTAIITAHENLIDERDIADPDRTAYYTEQPPPAPEPATEPTGAMTTGAMTTGAMTTGAMTTGAMTT